MSKLKKAMADTLATYMRNNLPPSLGIKVGVMASQWEEPTEFPSVRILPGKFTFMPWQANEVDDSLDDVNVLEIGTMEGTVQIRISAKTSQERDEVEDAVANLFLSDELRPGVLPLQTPAVTLGGIATAYQAPVSFTMEDAEFHDEMVFSKKRYTFMDLNAYYPALVARRVATIEELVLAFTDDLGSTAPEESVLVHDDGTITPTNL